MNGIVPDTKVQYECFTVDVYPLFDMVDIVTSNFNNETNAMIVSLFVDNKQICHKWLFGSNCDNFNIDNHVKHLTNAIATAMEQHNIDANKSLFQTERFYVMRFTNLYYQLVIYNINDEYAEVKRLYTSSQHNPEYDYIRSLWGLNEYPSDCRGHRFISDKFNGKPNSIEEFRDNCINAFINNKIDGKGLKG